MIDTSNWARSTLRAKALPDVLRRAGEVLLLAKQVAAAAHSQPEFRDELARRLGLSAPDTTEHELRYRISHADSGASITQDMQGHTDFVMLWFPGQVRVDVVVTRSESLHSQGDDVYPDVIVAVVKAIMKLPVCADAHICPLFHSGFNVPVG